MTADIDDDIDYNEQFDVTIEYDNRYADQVNDDKDWDAEFDNIDSEFGELDREYKKRQAEKKAKQEKPKIKKKKTKKIKTNLKTKGGYQ